MSQHRNKHKGVEIYEKASEVGVKKEDLSKKSGSAEAIAEESLESVESVFDKETQNEAENIEVVDQQEDSSSKEEKKQSLKDKIVNKVISKEALNKKIVELESRLAEKENLLLEKKKKIEELEQKIKELEASTLNLIAENRNQRQRLDKEKETAVKYALEGFFKEFIIIKDDFEKALSFAAEDTTPFAEGMRHLNTNLEKAMAKSGLVGYSALGTKFDHNLHQAVRMVDAPDKEPGEIVAEYCKGYQFLDRIIRPAMVEVATGNKPEEKSETKTED